MTNVGRVVRLVLLLGLVPGLAPFSLAHRQPAGADTGPAVVLLVDDLAVRPADLPGIRRLLSAIDEVLLAQDVRLGVVTTGPAHILADLRSGTATIDALDSAAEAGTLAFRAAADDASLRTVRDATLADMAGTFAKVAATGKVLLVVSRSRPSDAEQQAVFRRLAAELQGAAIHVAWVDLDGAGCGRGGDASALVTPDQCASIEERDGVQRLLRAARVVLQHRGPM